MNINFSSVTLQDEDKNRVKKIILEFVDDIDLNLNSLDGITITGDFINDITTFQIKYGKKERGATNHEGGIAIAKVLDYINDKNEFRQNVFINEEFVEPLLRETDLNRQESLHFIHHELVHVHDDYIKKINIYTNEGIQGIGSHQLDHIFRTYADSIWSEFIAERLSISTVNEKVIIRLITHTLDLVEYTQKNSKKMISSYRLSGNIEKLFQGIKDDCILLLKITANLMGVLHGFISANSEFKNQFDEIHKKFEGTFFYELWVPFYNELSKLFEIYPNWNNTYELDKLGKIIIKTWNNLGLYPKKDNDQLYIDVPF